MPIWNTGIPVYLWKKGDRIENGHDGHSLRLQDVHGLKWIRL